MPNYETLVLLDPALGDDEQGKLVAQWGKEVSILEGKVLKEDKLGRKRLAYPIKKKAEGSYICLYVEMPGKSLSQWQRFLRLQPNVLRQMTVKAEV